MALQNSADAELLLHWYQENKRSLPWRDTGNPEDVWISEIMLQQTRVEAVKEYFVRFREALPTLEDIAACPDETLLRLWEGLGYYTRGNGFNYDGYIAGDGYVWLSYISWAGPRRYIAVGPNDGRTDTTWGTGF